MAPHTNPTPGHIGAFLGRIWHRSCFENNALAWAFLPTWAAIKLAASLSWEELVSQKRAPDRSSQLRQHGLDRPPAPGLDPDTNDLGVAASPAPRKRLGREPFVDQTRNHACVEAKRCEQRLRQTTASRGRKQGECAALLGCQAFRAGHSRAF